MTSEPAPTASASVEAAEELVHAIDTALVAEHWQRTGLRTPPSGMFAAAWTGPDRTVHLMITCAPGELTTADLTGHPAGHRSAPIWSLFITDPTERQLLAAARTAADLRLRDVVTFADRLQRAGWNVVGDDKPTGTLCQITRADERRSLTRLNGDADAPGGWILDGDGLHADATDGTPTAVLAALALIPSALPEPSVTRATEADAVPHTSTEPQKEPDPE